MQGDPKDKSPSRRGYYRQSDITEKGSLHTKGPYRQGDTTDKGPYRQGVHTDVKGLPQQRTPIGTPTDAVQFLPTRGPYT